MSAALACPGPVVRLKQEMDNLNTGESLELLAPQSFDVDLMNWIKSSGNELVSQEMKTDYLSAIIRRRIPGRGVSCAACGSRGTDRRNRIVQQRSGQSDGGAHHCMRHGRLPA